eukprot:5668171-Pleurochrysis_carterae.AAC.2
MATRIWTRATVGDRAQVRGLGAPTGRLWVGGRSAGSGSHARARVPEPRERSASAPQVRMRCDYNLGNCKYAGAGRCLSS